MELKPIGPVMLDLCGTVLSPKERQQLLHPMVGGVIIFSRNIESAAQLIQLNREIKTINPDLILAIDQEGGRVQRIKSEVTALPCLQKLSLLYKQSPSMALATTAAHGQLMASEMLALGFDISFAPVLDIEIGISKVIGDRALGDNPETVTQLGSAYIEGMMRVGMSATGKHFPGHGSIAADSHHDIPTDPRSLEEIENWDLKPFSQLATQLEGIMPAHVIYPKVSPDPAGFSNFWLQQILRTRLKFEGVIFSDDLSMEGAKVAGSFTDRATAAIQAGCDMILVCNHPEAAQAVIDHLHQHRASSWLQESITAAQPRLRKLLKHDQFDWESYQTSSERQQLQATVAQLSS